MLFSAPPALRVNTTTTPEALYRRRVLIVLLVTTILLYWLVNVFHVPQENTTMLPEVLCCQHANLVMLDRILILELLSALYVRPALIKLCLVNRVVFLVQVVSTVGLLALPAAQTVQHRIILKITQQPVKPVPPDWQHSPAVRRARVLRDSMSML